MIVNCAHGKGIKFIREELKFFAKTNIQGNSGVLFKTIVLINADNLTIDAQSALRRCIELFSTNTRFFIVVENKHKLLNPILSRFCEIYVPEYIRDGKVLNLHQYSLHKNLDLSEIDKEAIGWVSNKMKDFCTSPNISENSNGVYGKMVDLSTEFYENGISCLDVMKWIEVTDTIDGKTKADVFLYFDRNKSEYRCEKLLMLCIFDNLFGNISTF